MFYNIILRRIFGPKGDNVHLITVFFFCEASSHAGSQIFLPYMVSEGLL